LPVSSGYNPLTGHENFLAIVIENAGVRIFDVTPFAIDDGGVKFSF
jgi:hypothetical protein